MLGESDMLWLLEQSCSSETTSGRFRNQEPIKDWSACMIPLYTLSSHKVCLPPVKDFLRSSLTEKRVKMATRAKARNTARNKGREDPGTGCMSPDRLNSIEI